jgi:hypothetical protein
MRHRIAQITIMLDGFFFQQLDYRATVLSSVENQQQNANICVEN